MTLLESLLEKNSLPDYIAKMTTEEMEARVRDIKQMLRKKLYIAANHYQKDEIVQFADSTGDSLQLAQLCENNKDAAYIIFCGVHFMTETADILTDDQQTVLLPDLRAGRSLAD